MVYIPGVGTSSIIGGLAGVPGPTGATGAAGANGAAGADGQDYTHDPQHIVLFDEFERASGDWTTISVNSGTFDATGQTEGINSTGQAFGIYRLHTGGSSATGVGGIGSINSSILAGVQNLDMAFRIKIPTLSDGSNRYEIIAGFSDTDASSSEGVDGIYFLYAESSSPNWICCTVQTGTNTRTTSSQPIITSGYVWLRIRTDATTAYFYHATVYGTWTLLTSISTNFPSGASQQFGQIFKICKKIGTTLRAFYIDCRRLEITWTTDR